MKKLIRRSNVTLALLTVPVAAVAEERTITLVVNNMVCVICASNVKKSLERVGGVVKVQVSLSEKTTLVVYDDAKTDRDALIAATARAGFRSIPKD